MFLVLGFISFQIAESLNESYREVRNTFINELNGKNLSSGDIQNIEQTLHAINAQFHTGESIAIHVKKASIEDIQYINLDFTEAQHVFPMNADNQVSLLTELFYVTEGFNAGEYYFVHRYFPDWYYVLPIALFIISALLFVLWAYLQLKYMSTTKILKFRFNEA
ncbi:hypothetical protein ACIQXI_09760 [Lysinibacillus sp. NPDC097195]|uniref:hypothetical protein n=1 Tax=Lysinibacillus sp. NPDC097195 TaxID=3364141 RepID=UPI0038244C40